MQKFKIKPEYKCVVKEPFRDKEFKKLDSHVYTAIGMGKEGFVTYFLDEMFEKVEERIELDICDTRINTLCDSLQKTSGGMFTDQEKELCEGILNVDPELAEKFLRGELGESMELTGTIPDKSEAEKRIEVRNLHIEVIESSVLPWGEYKICFESEASPKYDDIKGTLEAYLNGDMVEIDKPIETQYFNSREYGFNVKDGVLTVYPLKTIEHLSNEEMYEAMMDTKGVEKITLTDTGTLKNGWDEKTQDPVNGDELIMTDGEDQGLFTKEQMIEKVNGFIEAFKFYGIYTDKYVIDSFKEFINKKGDSEARR